MATRGKVVQEKYLKINSKLHHRIKLLALESGIEMRALANAMLESVLGDERRITELVASLEADSEDS